MPATELSTLVAWLNEPTRTIVAHLAKNALDPTVELIDLASVVECDFAGYAPVQITDWQGIDFDDADYAEASSGEIEFTAGDTMSAQGAYYAYLTVQEAGHAAVLWQAIPLGRGFIFKKPGDVFVYGFRVTSANIQTFTPFPSEV